MVLSCLPSPLKTDKKEEINDVQLEQLVRYKGELPGWECGQVLGMVSRGSLGTAPYLEVSRPRGSGGPWWLSRRQGCGPDGHFLAVEVGSLLPIVLWVPTGEPLARRRAPGLGSPRR